MIWNYRIIEHDTVKPTYFAVHEVYYDQKGRISEWTTEPVDVTGDNVQEITATLRDMLADIKQPVLKESQLDRKVAQDHNAKHPRNADRG